MKLGIMQPYFFPYIGYFQLMNAVDQFVVYDNIEYSKGWINRNRILVNGTDTYISIPLRKDSDFKFISERALAETWEHDRLKLLNRIREAYRKAPHTAEVMGMVEAVFLVEERNLFRFLLNSLEAVRQFLGIETPLVVSSSVAADHTLKASDRVMAICKSLGAKEYMNPIGGVELYSKTAFLDHGIKLSFLKADDISYKQFANAFVPQLSVLDVLMFNSRDIVRDYLKRYTLQ